MDDTGTYLEDFLLSIEHAPNDFRRDCEQLRNLDKESLILQQELSALEEAHLLERKQFLAASNMSAMPSNNSELKQRETICNEQREKIALLRERIQQLLSQKVTIATSMSTAFDRCSKKLDADLAFFETELRSCGEFHTAKGAEPGAEVAFRIRTHGNTRSSNSPPGLSPNLAALQQQPAPLALGKVIFYHADVGAYDVLDIDDSKMHCRLPEHEVIVLDLPSNSQQRLTKGELVFALYPDTTSFYHAEVSQAPRRLSQGAEPSVIVQFTGDEDESGFTPHLTVPLKYVIRQNPAPVLTI